MHQAARKGSVETFGTIPQRRFLCFDYVNFKMLLLLKNKQDYLLLYYRKFACYLQL